MMASSDNSKSAQSLTESTIADPVAGRYRLERQIGAGGMGSVWLAHDLLLDAACAVKIIDEDKSADEEIRTRFVREAKASAQLRSPHVVDVFDYGEWGGSHFIAMEYLEGEDLASRLTRLGTLDPQATYRIVAHIARALMGAHAQGIVHRDLKPENVFLVQSYGEEIAKVLDFGIAQHNAYALDKRATREGAFLGTPCYMSPEQARGKPIDHRSDLWSLGVIAYQCLTGYLPFEAEALGEVMGRILYEPLPKATTFNGELPVAIDRWWERACSRDREQRFQSAKEMADELGLLLGMETVVTVPSVPPRQMGSLHTIEQSGLIAGPNVKHLPASATAPDAKQVQSSVVKVVSATATTLDERSSTDFSRESRTQLSPRYISPLWRRFKALHPRVKWLVLALPSVIALVLLGVVLVLTLTSRSVSSGASATAPSGSALSSDVSKSGVNHAPHAPIVPAKQETLTVDMLPLVPSGQSAKGSPDTGPKRAAPGLPAPGASNTAKSSRDYGI